MNFKAYKLRVKNEEHCKKIQDWAFSKGYGWGCALVKNYDQLDTNYLFLSKEGFITYCNSKSFFEDHNYEEVLLSQLTSKVLRGREVKVGDLRKFYATNGEFFMYTVLRVFEENKNKFCKVMILEKTSAGETGQTRTFLYKDVVKDRRVG